MTNFNHPTASLKIGGSLNFRFFLTTRADMRNIPALFNRLAGTSITGIKTKIPGAFRRRWWAEYHNTVQRFFQQPDVMCIRAGYGDCQWNTLALSQQALLHAVFPLPVGFAPTFSCPRGDFFIAPSTLCHSQSIPASSSYFISPADHMDAKKPAASHS